MKVGDKFPPTKFKYIPYTEETSDVIACGIATDFDTEKVHPGNLRRRIGGCKNETDLVGIQGKEGCVVCSAWGVYARMSNQASPALRRKVRGIKG